VTGRSTYASRFERHDAKRNCSYAGKNAAFEGGIRWAGHAHNLG